MILFVYGQSASGKSAYAEARAVRMAGTGKKIYLAAMKPCGDDAVKRIRRHQALRRGKGFQTIERYTDISGLCAGEDFKRQAAGSTVLLECLSNLTANEMYEEGGAGDRAADAVIRGIGDLASLCGNLIIVSLDVFSDGIVYDPGTEMFKKNLGQINREAVSLSDEAVRVIYSLPVRFK